MRRAARYRITRKTSRYVRVSEVQRNASKLTHCRNVDIMTARGSFHSLVVCRSRHKYTIPSVIEL